MGKGIEVRKGVRNGKKSKGKLIGEEGGTGKGEKRKGTGKRNGKGIGEVKEDG